MSRMFFHSYYIQIGHWFWRLHGRACIIGSLNTVYYLFYIWPWWKTSLRLPTCGPSLILISHVYRTFLQNYAVLKRLLLPRETLAILFRVLYRILLQNNIRRVNSKIVVQRREFLLRAHDFHERWQFFDFIFSEVLHLRLLECLNLHDFLSQLNSQPMIQLHHFLIFNLSVL